MAETYYIDGYNLLHKNIEWSLLAKRDLEAARDALVEALAQWCAATGHQVKIIFDGSGIRTETADAHPSFPGMEIVFTSRRASADAIIERGVYGERNKEKVIVVTADHAIRDLCTGMGAMTMSPEYFLSILGEVASNMSARVSRTQTGKRLGTIEEHLDATERERLEETRKRLDET